MPEYAGGIKYPVPADKYNTDYGEPEWWRDLAITTRAEILAQVQAAAFVKAPLVPGDDLNDALTPGVYPYWAGVTNAPSTSGFLVVSELRSTAGVLASTQHVAYTTGSRPEIHMRFTGSLGWSGWTRVDAGAIDLTTLGGGSGGSPAQLKTVPLALTVGGSGTAGATSGSFRMPIRYGASISRWRLHFRNINPRFGTDGPSASISSVYFGQATAAGQFTSSPAQIATGLSTGGGDAVTPWQSTPINAGTQYAVGYAFSASSTNQVVGGGWSASSVNSTSATLTRVVSLPLDVWIEAEVSPEVPVIAAFGDSLSSGVGATLPVHDSWLSQWARSNGALPVHYTASGDTMAGWADSNAYKWQRWQALSRPDAVIHAMGSNDVFGGADLTTMRSRRATSMEQLRKLVSPVIVSATIMPRTVVAPGAQETVRRSYNTWLKGYPDAARDVFDFVPAMSADDENISPGFDADGIHLNTIGYTALAGTITRPLAASPPSGDLSVAWADITGKPVDFPPQAHTHTGLSSGSFSVDLSTAGAFALRSSGSNMVQWDASSGTLVAGNVPWARVTNRPTSFPSSWGDVSGKPPTYPPESHSHSEVKNGAVTWRVSSAGAIAANVDGGNTWQIDGNTGRLVAGNVPWSRLTDVPVTDYAAAIAAYQAVRGAV